MPDKPASQVRFARAAILGFACHQAFLFSLLYLGSNQGIALGTFVFERAELVGILLFMIAAFSILRCVPSRIRTVLLSRTLLWCYAGVLVLCSLASVLFTSPNALKYVCEFIFLGFPLGFMFAAWGGALGGFAIEKSIPETFIGSALGAAVCFICACIPEVNARIVLCFLPLGSALALAYLLSNPQEQAPVLNDNNKNTTRLSVKIMAGAAVFGLATGFMETYTSEPGMQTTPTFPVTLFLFVMFCLAALQVFGSEHEGKKISLFSMRGSSGQGPLDDVYRLSMMLMMAGFLFVPVLGDFGVPGEAIVLAGYLGLVVLFLSLFLAMGRISLGDTALSFARGLSALYGGEMVGVAFGNLLEVSAFDAQTPYIIVACAGLATLFSFLFLFTERDFRALSLEVRKTDTFEEVCARLAKTAGLSSREAEILPFALRGRTGERIASEFYISKSTVDTHLRRIYQKCGVHSRQELIDLVEKVDVDAQK